MFRTTNALHSEVMIWFTFPQLYSIVVFGVTVSGAPSSGVVVSLIIVIGLVRFIVDEVSRFLVSAPDPQDVNRIRDKRSTIESVIRRIGCDELCLLISIYLYCQINLRKQSNQVS